MTSRERMAMAMSHDTPDRTPVMCQLSLGHYFLNCKRAPSKIWFDSEAFVQSLLELQQRYGFDGILMNLPGRPNDWERHIVAQAKAGDAEKIVWDNGFETYVPKNDNAHTYFPGNKPLPIASIESIDLDDPESFKIPGYIWSVYGMPQLWDFAPNADLSDPTCYPSYFTNTLKAAKKLAHDISLHVEVFSPFSHFLELFGYEESLMALVEYPEISKNALAKLTQIVLAQVRLYAAEGGADAMLVSSPFAGAGFISRDLYKEFVMPYEDAVYREIKRHGMFAYVHTCGAIGDRLDLMAETSLDGVDTLDPAPLGTVDLKEAKEKFGKRFFLKGNLDSVNELLNADDKTFQEAVINRIKTGKVGGGYILSSACSVSPYVKPERLCQLKQLAEQYGMY